MKETVNGNFMRLDEMSEQEIKIVGTGSEVVTGNDSIKVVTIVTATEFYTEIIN